MQRTSIKITSDKLNLQECYRFVEDDSCGGISAFIGTVRNDTQGKEVTQLDFSTYKPMAIKEMQKIAELTLEKFDIYKIAVHHAEGVLKIGDIPVIITVSSFSCFVIKSTTSLTCWRFTCFPEIGEIVFPTLANRSFR